MTVVGNEGIIGAGKTTLMRIMGELLPVRTLPEPADMNPYLTKFYKDKDRWAFTMQIYLLHQRFKMQQLAGWEVASYSNVKGAVLDRTLVGDRVFAKMLTEDGYIDELDWLTYNDCFDSMIHQLVPPTVMIYLEVEPEVAYQRVLKRSRGAETGLPLDYLSTLKDYYDEMMRDLGSNSHKHYWSRGTEIIRIDWNDDDTKGELAIDLAKAIGKDYGLI